MPNQSPARDMVRDAIRNRIRKGTYKPEERIPPQSDLAKEFNVSRSTCHYAQIELKQEGYLYASDQSGTFVAPEENWPK